MRPVRTPESTVVFKLDGGTEENDLPAVVREDEAGTPVVCTTWELDSDDLAAVLTTGRLELCVWGAGTPPVSLVAVGPEGARETHHEQGPPIAWAHLERAVTRLVERLREAGVETAEPADVLAGLSSCLAETTSAAPASA